MQTIDAVKGERLMMHPLDGAKVIIVRGKHRYAIGRVLRGQAFLARGHLTLTIRTDDAWLFATPKQVEVL